MGIEMIAVIFHLVCGTLIGVNIQRSVDQEKYKACVYKEKKAELKEMKQDCEECE